MKLSDRTVDLLKSFSTLNPSIMLTPGKKLSTMAPSETVVAESVIEEEFEDNYAIYNLPQFINVLSLFDDYDMTFTKEHVTIKGETRKLRYSFCSPNLITLPPEGGVEFPEPEIEFEMPQNSFKTINKAISMLTAQHIAFVGNSKEIHLETLGATNDDNYFDMKVGETDKVFNFITKPEHLKMFPGDYKVRISKEGIAEFVTVDMHTGKPTRYWIIAEEDSTFE